MSCCRERITDVTRRLRARGQKADADKIDALFEVDGYKSPKGLPAKCRDVYNECRDKYKNEEYCARIAWSVCCQDIEPGYKGCTKKGKTKGPPYSGPLTKPGKKKK